VVARRGASPAARAQVGLEDMPEDVLVIIVAQLDLHDRFRFGGTCRKLRRAFKHPEAWARVVMQGHGYLHTLLWRTFRVGHLGVEHFTIHAAELHSPSLTQLVDAAARHSCPKLRTITLGSNKCTTLLTYRQMSEPANTLRQNQKRIMDTLSKARRAFPLLSRVEVHNPVEVARVSFKNGFIQFLADLHAQGLTVHTAGSVNVTDWPRTPAERAALSTLIGAQTAVKRLQLEAVSDATEDHELVGLMSSKGLTNLRLAVYDPLPPTASRAFLNACFSGVATLDTVFVHGLDLRGFQMPPAAALRNLTLSQCTVDDVFCASLPPGLACLGVPQTRFVGTRSLRTFIAGAERLVYLNIGDIRVPSRADLYDVLLAASSAPSLKRLNAYNVFLDEAAMGFVSAACKRGVVVEVLRKFVTWTYALPEVGPCLHVH